MDATAVSVAWRTDCRHGVHMRCREHPRAFGETWDARSLTPQWSTKSEEPARRDDGTCGAASASCATAHGRASTARPTDYVDYYGARLAQSSSHVVGDRTAALRHPAVRPQCDAESSARFAVGLGWCRERRKVIECRPRATEERRKLVKHMGPGGESTCRCATQARRERPSEEMKKTRRSLRTRSTRAGEVRTHQESTPAWKGPESKEEEIWSLRLGQARISTRG